MRYWATNLSDLCKSVKQISQPWSTMNKLAENLQTLPEILKAQCKLVLITYSQCLYLLQGVFVVKILSGVPKTRRKYLKLSKNT